MWHPGSMNFWTAWAAASASHSRGGAGCCRENPGGPGAGGQSANLCRDARRGGCRSEKARSRARRAAVWTARPGGELLTENFSRSDISVLPFISGLLKGISGVQYLINRILKGVFIQLVIQPAPRQLGTLVLRVTASPASLGS